MTKTFVELRVDYFHRSMVSNNIRGNCTFYTGSRVKVRLPTGVYVQYRHLRTERHTSPSRRKFNLSRLWISALVFQVTFMLQVMNLHCVHCPETIPFGRRDYIWYIFPCPDGPGSKARQAEDVVIIAKSTDS